MESACILQVEDDENDIFFLENAFQEAKISHPLHVVRDGQAAIEYLSGTGKYTDRSQYPLPCLVLLDLKLPRKMGLEVLKWMREQAHLQIVPVIILTSSSQPTDVEAAYRLGASSYLVKPSGVYELFELIKVFKAYWLEHNLIPSTCVDPQMP
jgi:CheY-like chemotaxis protein